MRSLPNLLSLFCLLLLSQCSTVSPGAKASYKRVVVTSNVGKQVTRYKVGFTAFGNKQADDIRTPELQKASSDALRRATQGKFPEVIYSQEEPPHPPQKLFASGVDYAAWAKDLGAKYKADAVLLVGGYNYYPYGAPSYMSAEGMGIWHSGNTAQIQCYQFTMLVDTKTGKPLRRFGRFKNGLVLPNIEFKEKFQDYSPADKSRLIQTCADEYLAELNAYLKGIGY